MTKTTPKKYKLKLNSLGNLEILLQELYDETSKNIVEIQNEINKLSNSTLLNQEIMDGKAKYAKAMNDFSSNKNKALATKMDIAKIMAEVIKFNGNLKKMNDESEEVPNWGDFVSNINNMAEAQDMTDNRVETYITK
jgi:predicted  nucleic acid-binding Zn-ribbon protein